jgi:hypothetical protein
MNFKIFKFSNYIVFPLSKNPEQLNNENPPGYIESYLT